MLEQNIIGDDLKFDIDIITKKKSFATNFINECCDNRRLVSFKNGILDNFEKNTEYNQELKFRECVNDAFGGILGNNEILRKNCSREDAIHKLMQNWFMLDYKIRYEGDDITDMSPGKKSFVLLKLLIELDKSNSPILLDQPEDDLDNRSIYNKLAKFIKEKKKTRQIIIVTHNPNLVVGTDAECIIVANQDKKKENQKYQFEYYEGALEDSFLDKKKNNILEKQGIREHVCDVLEGGRIAFEERQRKYNIS